MSPVSKKPNCDIPDVDDVLSRITLSIDNLSKDHVRIAIFTIPWFHGKTDFDYLYHELTMKYMDRGWMGPDDKVEHILHIVAEPRVESLGHNDVVKISTLDLGLLGVSQHIKTWLQDPYSDIMKDFRYLIAYITKSANDNMQEHKADSLYPHLYRNFMTI